MTLVVNPTSTMNNAMDQMIDAKPDSLFSFSLSKDELLEGITAQLTPENSTSGPVIWQDAESRVIVHVEKCKLAITDSFVIIDLPLETDQTGTGNLVAAFRMGKELSTASLTLTTEDLPRGNRTLAQRWGPIVQEQLWYCLLNLGEYCRVNHLQTDRLNLTGMFCQKGTLTYVYGRLVSLSEIKAYVEQVESQGLDPDQDNFAPEAVDMGSPGSVTLFEKLDPCKQLSEDFRQWLRELVRLLSRAVRLLASLIRKQLG